MSKVKIIFGLGLFTAVMPFLGFPSSWKDFFLLAIGLAISALAFIIHYNGKKNIILPHVIEKVTDTYVEKKKPVIPSDL